MKLETGESISNWLPIEFTPQERETFNYELYHHSNLTPN